VSELLVTNCSQLVTLAGPSRPRVGHELRETAAIPGPVTLVFLDGDLKRDLSYEEVWSKARYYDRYVEEAQEAFA